MTDLRRGPRGNPELAAELEGSTLSELADHCTTVLQSRPMSDAILRRILNDMFYVYRRVQKNQPETTRHYRKFMEAS